MDPLPRRPTLHWPVSLPFLGALFALLVGLVAALWVGALTYAYGRLGISPGWAVTILAASLLGSAVNLPLARVETGQPHHEERVVRFLGVRYVVPAPVLPEATVVAVNVGGALVPMAVSTYLIVHNQLGAGTAAAIAIVAFIVHLAATPVKGVGIAVPALLPPLTAALAGVLLGGQQFPATAYVAGSLGTLLGGDILNLGRLRELGAPVASIGGAGTFDGVFLSGVMAVLFATL